MSPASVNGMAVPDWSVCNILNLSKYMNPILVILGVLVALVYLCGIASYILRGIGVLKLSKNAGIKHGWLGFIPIACEFQIGAIAGQVQIGKKTVKRTGLWMILWPIIAVAAYLAIYIPVAISFAMNVRLLGEDPHGYQVLSLFSNAFGGFFLAMLVLYVLTIVYSIFYYMVLHKIFKQYHSDSRPVFYILMCMFVPMAEPILLLMHGNKKPIEAVAAVEEVLEVETVAEVEIVSEETQE